MLSGFEFTVVGLVADCVSVMSDKSAGVQALLKNEHPWYINVQFAGHRPNLVSVKDLKNMCPTMIKIVDKLHSLINSAKTNDSFKAS